MVARDGGGHGEVFPVAVCGHAWTVVCVSVGELGVGVDEGIGAVGGLGDAGDAG